MPHYRVSRHEDWIAVLEVEADNAEAALETAHNLGWSESETQFNDAVANSYEVEECSDR